MDGRITRSVYVVPDILPPALRRRRVGPILKTRNSREIDAIVLSPKDCRSPLRVPFALTALVHTGSEAERVGNRASLGRNWYKPGQKLRTIINI